MNGGDQKRSTDGRFRGGMAEPPGPTEPIPVQYDPPTPRIKTHHRNGGKKKSWER